MSLTVNEALWESLLSHGKSCEFEAALEGCLAAEEVPPTGGKTMPADVKKMKRRLARYGTSLSHRGSFPLHAGMRLAHSTSLMVRPAHVPEPQQFIKTSHPHNMCNSVFAR